MLTTDQKQTSPVIETSLQPQPMNGSYCSPSCCGTNDASKTAAEK